MIKQSGGYRSDYLKRQRDIRLQRHPGGAVQLPARRGGPMVLPSDPDFTYTPLTDLGLRVHKNKKNRFCVIQWHYTADPDKRDPEFKRKGRASNPSGWDQEMEIDFKSKRGIKVFSEFSWEPGLCDMGDYWSSETNVILPMKPPPEWWLLYLSTDPGRNRHWATLFVLIDEYGCWHVVQSLLKQGLHYTEAKKIISGKLRRRRPLEHIIDPASNQRRTESNKTLIEKMSQSPFPMECVPATRHTNEYVSIEILRERMMKRADGRFGMYFWAMPENMEVIEQFRNAVYADELGERLEDADVDAIDAGKYLATYETGQATKAKKPVEKMNPREYRAHKALMFRRDKQREMTAQQKHRNSAIAEAEEASYSIEGS